MVPKTGQLRIANVDENDLRHSYTCRIVNKLTGFTQESNTLGRIYFGKFVYFVEYPILASPFRVLHKDSMYIKKKKNNKLQLHSKRKENF